MQQSLPTEPAPVEANFILGIELSEENPPTGRKTILGWLRLWLLKKMGTRLSVEDQSFLSIYFPAILFLLAPFSRQYILTAAHCIHTESLEYKAEDLHAVHFTQKNDVEKMLEIMLKVWES